MSATILLVVLLAALLHASWNFLVKKAADKHLSMSAVVIGHLPFSFAALCFAPFPSFSSLPYLLIGVMLHVGYQLFLLNSYRLGDLSQVYTLARGVAPLLVTGVSLALLGVHLSWSQLAAIATIGVGIISLSRARRTDDRQNGRAVLLAITTGCFIAAYSLVDGFGAREAGTALGFYGGLSLLNALVFAAIMRITRPGLVKKLVCQNWRFLLVGGGASFGAYAMVTWAFTQAPIALVAALRETSIIFAVLYGVYFLGERLDLMKVTAVLLTLLGIGLLRIPL